MLDQLLGLETTKRLTPADDPAFPALARQVEDAARALLERAALQATITVRVHDDAVAIASSATIQRHSRRRVASADPDDVAGADRELGTLEPGSSRALEVEGLVTALRQAYQRAQERDT